MNSELRLDAMMKSIDLYGRLAYGGLCVAVMALIAAPLLFITASVLPFRVWDDGRAEAVLIWLGGWALSLGVGIAGIAFGVFCWRWSGDWITEWPGYAVGIGIAGTACAVLALMLTSTPVPVYASFIATAGTAFLAGFLVAGHLAGTRVMENRRRPRILARRR